jgi:hypothetical protein
MHIGIQHLAQRLLPLAAGLPEEPLHESTLMVRLNI